MQKLIVNYLLTANPEEQQRLILGYPLLLSQVAERLLDEVIGKITATAPQALKQASGGMDLLRRCRELGVDSVFPAAFSPNLKGLPRPNEKEMVLIPAGDSLFGSDQGDPEKGEGPTRTAYLDAYFIDKFPVTNSEYARFILQMGYPTTERRMGIQVSGPIAAEEAASLESILLGDLASRGFRLSAAQTHPHHPAVEITWYDAVEYARWAGKRLPTAQEWEKAARHPDGRDWSWGFEPDSSRGNTRESGIGTTTAVTKYAEWPSPHGCCDLSGNAAEWTATAHNEGTLNGQSYLIKGGGWMLQADEARAWKCFDDDARDVWNVLGFRCCRSVEEERDEDFLQTYQIRTLAQRTLELDVGDSPLLIPLLGLIRASLGGQISVEDGKEHLTKILRDPSTPSSTSWELIEAINSYARSRAHRSPLAKKATTEVSRLAELGLHMAEEMKDGEFLTRARQAHGLALLIGNDLTGAVTVLDECLTHRRLHLEEEKELALILLDLGTAEAARNLSSGASALDAPKAKDHLQEALPVFQNLGMHLEEQRTLCQLAVVHRLLGDMQATFETAQQALAETAASADVSTEVRGMLLVGDVFLDIHAFDHAAYCFRMAHERASAIPDAELVYEAAVRQFLASSLTDPAAAARHGALALENLAFFDLDQFDAILGVVASAGGDPTASLAINGFLGNLLSFFREGNAGLPFLPLSEGALGYALGSADTVHKSAEALARYSPPEGGSNGYFIHSLLALASLVGDPEEALRLSELAVRAARDTGNPYFLVNARQIRIEVAKQLAQWHLALEEIRFLTPQIRGGAQPDQLASYLAYEAQLDLWAGEVSAALEACDETTIEILKKLESVSASVHQGNVSLLRSRILLAIGSRDALIESEAATLPFFYAGHRLGNAEQMIQSALAFLHTSSLPPESTFAAAARRLEWAREVLATPISGGNDRRLTCKLLLAVAELRFRGGDSLRATKDFENASSIAQDTQNHEAQIEALAGLTEIRIAEAAWTAAARLAEQALALARPRGRPFELLALLTQAGLVSARLADLDRAFDTLQEALGLYRRVRMGIRNAPGLRKAWLKKNRRLFEILVGDVLLHQDRSEEAILLLEQMKAAALSDLLNETRQATAFGLPVATRDRARQLWREIRQHEVQLEELDALVGDEIQKYEARLSLRRLRHEWRSILDEASPSISQEDSGLEFSRNSLEELLQTLGRSTVVIELFATSSKLYVFVLAAERRTFVHELNQINREQLVTEITTRFVHPYRSFHSRSEHHRDETTEEQFPSSVAGLLEYFHTAIFTSPGRDGRTLLQILIDMHPKHVILIPSDILAALPLQAAFTIKNGEARSLLDDFPAVSIAPSLGILKHSLLHSASSQDNLMVVDNPDGTLKNASFETEFVASLFSSPTIFAHREARKARILEQLPHATVAHFACHGVFDTTSPLDSGLVLAGESLTLAEIYMNTTSLSGGLVVLSSCESGLIDLNFADEFLGLPSGFLYLGAAGVICSLWQVDDLSTALLMHRFYEIWMKGGIGIAEALGGAQIWLRDVSREEVLMILKTHVDRLWSRGATAQANHLRGIMAHLHRRKPDRPFSHPFYWSAFQAVGNVLKSPLYGEEVGHAD